MLVKQVALVSDTSSVSTAELMQAAAALQKQVQRDFAPIWETSGSVDAFDTLDDVPLGYWPVIIKDNIGVQGAGGVHLDDNKQPYALVQAENFWQQATSHETLEMLADPAGNRLMTGASPKKGEGRVQFLVEVCDPCEATTYAYHVNGILVSDFYTPHYFDPAVTVGTRYSFSGAITQPRQVLKGGYLSWFDPVTKHWLQEDYLGPKPRIRDLGHLNIADTIRGTFDALRGAPVWHREKKAKGDLSAKAARAASVAMARGWEHSIAELA